VNTLTSSPLPPVGTPVRITNPASFFQGREGTVQSYVWREVATLIVNVWLWVEGPDDWRSLRFGLDECAFLDSSSAQGRCRCGCPAHPGRLCLETLDCLCTGAAMRQNAGLP
jgi:hypothetical protein